MLRSLMHGFATLEAEGGFQLGTDIDDSFTWLINFIDHGLQAPADDKARVMGQATTVTSTTSAGASDPAISHSDYAHDCERWIDQEGVVQLEESN